MEKKTTAIQPKIEVTMEKKPTTKKNHFLEMFHIAQSVWNFMLDGVVLSTAMCTLPHIALILGGVKT